MYVHGGSYNHGAEATHLLYSNEVWDRSLQTRLGIDHFNAHVFSYFS
jgi:hypothetical protein